MDKPLIQALSPKRASTPTSPPFRRLRKDRKKAMYFYGLRKAELIENVLLLQWLAILSSTSSPFPRTHPKINIIDLFYFWIEGRGPSQNYIIFYSMSYYHFHPLIPPIKLFCLYLRRENNSTSNNSFALSGNRSPGMDTWSMSWRRCGRLDCCVWWEE